MHQKPQRSATRQDNTKQSPNNQQQLPYWKLFLHTRPRTGTTEPKQKGQHLPSPRNISCLHCRCFSLRRPPLAWEFENRIHSIPPDSRSVSGSGAGRRESELRSSNFSHHLVCANQSNAGKLGVQVLDDAFAFLPALLWSLLLAYICNSSPGIGARGPTIPPETAHTKLVWIVRQSLPGGYSNTHRVERFFFQSLSLSLLLLLLQGMRVRGRGERSEI